MALRLWDIVWEEQSDPELEAARQRVVVQWNVTAGVVFFGGILPVLFSYL
jgi:hypothetical protein